jgi:hypothetical protein
MPEMGAFQTQAQVDAPWFKEDTNNTSDATHNKPSVTTFLTYLFSTTLVRHISDSHFLHERSWAGM